MLNWNAINLQEMLNHNPERMHAMAHLETETWYQDNEDSQLWHAENGVIVNTAALKEREAYYEIIKVSNQGYKFDLDQMDLFA